MASRDGVDPVKKKIDELERHNLMLRLHNLRLLEQLEKRHNGHDGADAVIYIQVKQAGGEFA